jgi:hypothetical protein
MDYLFLIRGFISKYLQFFYYNKYSMKHRLLFFICLVSFSWVVSAQPKVILTEQGKWTAAAYGTNIIKDGRACCPRQKG